MTEHYPTPEQPEVPSQEEVFGSMALRGSMGDTKQVVPQGVVDRLREKAREFSSGEDDLKMRELIEQKAFDYRIQKFAWGRGVAEEIRRRRSN